MKGAQLHVEIGDTLPEEGEGRGENVNEPAKTSQPASEDGLPTEDGSGTEAE